MAGEGSGRPILTAFVGGVFLVVATVAGVVAGRFMERGNVHVRGTELPYRAGASLNALECMQVAREAVQGSQISIYDTDDELGYLIAHWASRKAIIWCREDGILFVEAVPAGDDAAVGDQLARLIQQRRPTAFN